MKKNKQTSVLHKLKKSTIVVMVLLFFALIVLFVNFGKHIEPPYPLSVTIDQNDSTGVYKDGIGGVIIDHGKSRLIIYDKNKKVTSVVDSSIDKEELEYFFNARVTNNSVDVISYKTDQETNFIVHEQVTKYDYQGNVIDVSWKCDYDKNQQISVPRKMDFDLIVSDDDTKINNLQTNISYNDYIIDAKYNESAKTYAYLTNLGYIYKNGIQQQEQNAFARFISVDDTGVITTYENSPHKIEQGKQSEITSNFSFGLIVRTLLFWICLAYIIVLGAILLIKYIIKLEKNKLMIRIGIFLGVLCVLSVSVFYSVQFRNQACNERFNQLIVSSKNIASTPVNYVANNLNNYVNLSTYLLQMKDNEILNNFYADYSIAQVNNGNLSDQVVKCSTNCNIRPGTYDVSAFKDSFKLITVENPSIHSESNNYNSIYLVAATAVFNGNTPIAVVYASLNQQTLTSSIAYKSIMTTINLFVIIITIAMITLEFAGIFSQRKKHKKYLSLNIKNPEIAYSRFFGFLSNFILTFDSALMVLITKQALGDNPIVLVGLPGVCLSFGLMVAKPLSVRIARRVSIRKFISSACILLILCFAGCYYAVTESNLMLYSIMMVFSGIFTGIFSWIKLYMPLLSPTKEIRFDVVNNNTITSISSGVISIGISGIVASNFGPQYIYLMAVIPTVLLMFLTFGVFPKDTKYYQESKKDNKTKFVDGLKFFLSPLFISFALFMMMTDALATGYETFLYPLLSSDEGMSMMATSNFIVIANFIAFLISESAKRIFKNSNYVRMSILCTSITGLIFISFLINSTLLWATLVIAIIIVISKISMMSNNMIWPQLCKMKNYPEQTCNQVIMYFYDVVFILRNVLLSVMVSLGVVSACMWLGVFMIVGSIIFAICAKKFGIVNQGYSAS